MAAGLVAAGLDGASIRQGGSGKGKMLTLGCDSDYRLPDRLSGFAANG